jgi:thiol:disulfide interchange protein DsbD
MKKALFILSFFAIAFGILANINIGSDQQLEPVKWTHELIKISENEYMLRFDATIQDHWHVYSNNIEEGGPVATNIGSDELIGLTLDSNIYEYGNLEKEFDPNFDMTLKWYSNKVSFFTIIRTKEVQNKFKGYLNYMTCDDSKCMPPSYVDVEYENLSKKAIAIRVKDKELLKNAGFGQSTPEETTCEFEDKSLVNHEEKGLLLIFLLGFGGGFIALLTPCVFPMIPMTVSFFTKQSDNRAKGIMDAMIYGLSIIVIYVSLGLGLTAFLGPKALNALSTNVPMNIAFFLLFIVFASSFFGAFEITLPNKWINKADKASNKGGMIGIFFMAFTLALVSFSCTGPIAGTLLVQAASSQLGPAIGMFGFSLALALPFTLFAMFPGWLNSLPKSGGWLNSVKVVLGFIELALALKFLSIADLVSHWGILDREVFLVLWIVIFTMLGLYLIGKMKFSHDSDLPYISVTRLFMSIISFAFVVYLIPGLIGAPLSAISGFAPPLGTQDFVIENYHGYKVIDHGNREKKINAEGLHAPHNLDVYFDYDQAIQAAKKEGKPLFIDFTGHGCVNCREMEASVWSDEGVLKRLAEDFILVSLYVDDRAELAEPFVLSNGKEARQRGQKWSDLQETRFKQLSQPWYLIMDQKDKGVVAPMGTGSISEFIDFLEEGKSEFENRQVCY